MSMDSSAGGVHRREHHHTPSPVDSLVDTGHGTMMVSKGKKVDLPTLIDIIMRSGSISRSHTAPSSSRQVTVRTVENEFTVVAVPRRSISSLSFSLSDSSKRSASFSFDENTVVVTPSLLETPRYSVDDYFFGLRRAEEEGDSFTFEQEVADVLNDERVDIVDAGGQRVRRPTVHALSHKDSAFLRMAVQHVVIEIETRRQEKTEKEEVASTKKTELGSKKAHRADKAEKEVRTAGESRKEAARHETIRNMQTEKSEELAKDERRREKINKTARDRKQRLIKKQVYEESIVKDLNVHRQKHHERVFRSTYRHPEVE